MPKDGLGELENYGEALEKQTLYNTDIFYRCIACSKETYITKAGYNMLVCSNHMNLLFEQTIEFDIKERNEIKHWKTEEGKIYEVIDPLEKNYFDFFSPKEYILSIFEKDGSPYYKRLPTVDVEKLKQNESKGIPINGDIDLEGEE